MRTIIDLPETEVRRLDALARHEHCSRAALIRRAVEAFLAGQAKGGQDDEAFGLWAGREDGLDYQRRLRDEW